MLLVFTASNNRDSKAFGYRHSTLSYIDDAKHSVAKVRTVNEFWSWMNQTLLPFLYPIQNWNNKSLTRTTRLVNSFSSYRVGPLRIRQHRTRDELCSIDPHFQKVDIRCVYSWSSSYMDTRNYTRGWTSVIDNDNKTTTTLHEWSVWDYRNWWDLGGTPVMGVFGVYPSGGYVIDVSGDNVHAARKALSVFVASKWIDSLTRFVSVEFTLFCPGANLFAMVPVEFEFPQAEIMMGKVHIYPFRLFSYLSGYPTAQMACDVLVYLAVVWFVCREVFKIVKERCKYFTQFWNVVELLNLLLSITAITLYIGRLVITTYVSKDIGNVEGQYYNFQTLAMWNELFGILLGFVCFLSTLQLLNLLRFNRRMSLFGATLQEAATDLSAFFLVFVIVFLAFVSFSYVTFGSNLVRYSSVIRSIETLFIVALGKFDYYALIYVNHTLAPLFLFAYMMFIVFILINMLITILNDAFSVVRDDASKQPNDYELVDYIVARVSAFLSTLKPFRIVWSWAQNAGIVNTQPPKPTGESTTDKAQIEELKNRQPGIAGVDHRPRNRHRSTFNTNLVRLHNRLDNIQCLLDHFTKTLDTEVSDRDKIGKNKRRVSIGDGLFDDCHMLSLSILNESGSSSKEHVVPGILKMRHGSRAKSRANSHSNNHAHGDADTMDNVVPQIDIIASGSHSGISRGTEADDVVNLQNIEAMNPQYTLNSYRETENGPGIRENERPEKNNTDDSDDEADGVVPHFNMNTYPGSFPSAYPIEVNNSVNDRVGEYSHSASSKNVGTLNSNAGEEPLQNGTALSSKSLTDSSEYYSSEEPVQVIQPPSSFVKMPDESYNANVVTGPVDDSDQPVEQEMGRIPRQDGDGLLDQVVVDIDDQESSM